LLLVEHKCFIDGLKTCLPQASPKNTKSGIENLPAAGKFHQPMPDFVHLIKFVYPVVQGASSID